MTNRTPDRVYFVRYGESGPIKIGSTRFPRGRLMQLQVGTPTTLYLLGDICGDRQLEKNIQQRFAHTRLRGEWYAPTAELIAYVSEALAAGSPAVAA